MTRRILFTLALLACLGLAARATAQHAEGTEAKAGAAHSTAGEAGAAGEGHDGHKSYELLPKTDDPQTWYAALWVLIIFIVLLAVLYPPAWEKRLGGAEGAGGRGPQGKPRAAA